MTLTPIERQQMTAKIDSLEKELAKLPQTTLPLKHGFSNGFYIRTITMPKGVFVISKIHNTTHPFQVTKGHCVVWDGENGIQHIKAGYVGITKPGFRRLLYMIDETEWTTFHAGDWTPDTDPETIVKQVTIAHDVSNAPDLTEGDFSFIKQLMEN